MSSTAPPSEPPAAPGRAPRTPRLRRWLRATRRSARVRAFGRALDHAIPALAALLAALCGALAVRPYAARMFAILAAVEQRGAGAIDLASFPHVITGTALVLMSFGLLLRARIAWVIALLLGALVAALSWRHAGAPKLVFWIAALLVVLLIVQARRFDRSNLAASSLFALLSVGTLLLYGVLGSLWFGAGYSPAIRDLPTAFYYTIETMSTVGYGDIVPRTTETRMFTVSMIVLGITVFATTLSVVIGPLVGGSIKRALEGRMQSKQRTGHFVLIGTSALAYALWQRLESRGAAVTVIAPPGRPSPYPADADVITGDPTRTEVLEEAGVPHALAVLTLRDDDAENAFAVLAVKELAPQVKTVAAVNDARHLAKIQRVQPDMLFAPQVLGSDLLVRALFNEPIDKDTVDKLLFVRN